MRAGPAFGSLAVNDDCGVDGASDLALTAAVVEESASLHHLGVGCRPEEVRNCLLNRVQVCGVAFLVAWQDRTVASLQGLGDILARMRITVNAWRQ